MLYSEAGGMIHLSTETSFEGLRLVGLAADRCHIIEGSMVRVHFRLSSPPPLGWSYIFTTVWQSVQYPQKRPAGVEGDFIWIDCVPAEVRPNHIQKLEQAVARANLEYQSSVQTQVIDAERRTQLDAQLRSQLADLNRALYPAEVSIRSSGIRRRSWVSGFIARIGSLFSRGKRREH
jgi:hypothetical protein